MARCNNGDCTREAERGRKCCWGCVASKRRYRERTKGQKRPYCRPKSPTADIEARIAALAALAERGLPLHYDTRPNLD